MNELTIEQATLFIKLYNEARIEAESNMYYGTHSMGYDVDEIAISNATYEFNKLIY